MADVSQAETADAAWAAAKRRFLVPEMELLADYLGADGFAGLPTPNEVRRAFPDRHGYGTGQEDCMIHAGAMLDALGSRAESAESGAAPPAPWAVQDAVAVVLRHADPDRCTGCGLFHLIEALWRGLRQGSAHAKTIVAVKEQAENCS